MDTTTKPIQIRFTKSEFAQVMAQAKKKKIPITSLIRGMFQFGPLPRGRPKPAAKKGPRLNKQTRKDRVRAKTAKKLLQVTVGKKLLKVVAKPVVKRSHKKKVPPIVTAPVMSHEIKPDAAEVAE